jgi:hypothetical protein
MNNETKMSMIRARTAGLVLLLYLASIELVMIFVDRVPALYDTALILANVFYLVLALLFYAIFRPVSRWLSLAASVCGVAGCAIGLYHYVLRRAPHISSAPFFALFILLTGILIARSTFLPRILGWLMILSGIGWLVCQLPATPKFLSGNLGGFDFLVELLLALWLLIKGVNLPRWNAQASASASA